MRAFEEDDSPSEGAGGFRHVDALSEIKELLQGRSFDSIDQANEFIAARIVQRNQSPLDDFCSLSSEHMTRLLYSPFDSPELLEIADPLGVTPSAPIVTLFTLLYDAIGDGLKATATKGNLPVATVKGIALRYFGEAKYNALIEDRLFRSEEHFLDLHVTRIIAGLAGLIRKTRGRFEVTQKCRKLMAGSGVRGVYPLLFRKFVAKYNWAYRFRFGIPSIIQTSFGYTLFLLHRFGDEPRSNAFYEDLFLRAFPQVLDSFETYGNPEEILRMDYSLSSINYFAAFFGLAEVTTADGPWWRALPSTIRKLPLLDEFVRFKA